MGFGGVHVIRRVGGGWVGAADPRRDGEVRGY
jgi:gamma-glutamyltranspeptidase